MKKYLAGFAIAGLFFTYDSWAGAIKTWTTGDRLTAADLNSNFQHIHNAMVGGHGARLVDADVNAAANISSSKLAAYRFIPTAWAYVSTSCSGAGNCTLTASEGVTSVNHVDAGYYRVTLGYTATDTTMLRMINSNAAICSNADAGFTACGCYPAGTPTTTTFDFICQSDDSTRQDDSWSFIVLDNN